MSNRTVDDRVVSLEFDNKRFETNVAQTMGTLDKLKQKLNLPQSVKALDNLNAAANKVDLSGVNSAVDSINIKFSALQAVGVGALMRIGDQAMRTAQRLSTMFTIEPVLSGFQEYETQLNSVQTILAKTQSKGTTLEEVNSALDELNKYADKTIYNFTQMTRNIGTFTAAGVDLDKSVSSIKGIANLAAASGSSSMQASMAMYQLSQALAAGRVSLMDWNSVVNAGMGGQLFQDALKRTAKNMGKDVDGMIKKYGSFRESLTQGQWLTADVLTETLSQISGAYTEADLLAKGYTKEQAAEILELAQTAEDAATKVKTFSQLIDTTKEALGSGWAQTWEIIFGDFEEARQFWTNISDAVSGFVNKMSEARNSLLGGALSSKWNDFTKQLNEAGIATDAFEEKLTKVAKNNGEDVDALIKQYGSLRFAIDNGKISSEILKETLDELGYSEEKVVESTDGATTALEYYRQAVSDVWDGAYGNGQKRVKALTEAGYDYAEVQALVNKTVDDHIVNLEDLSEEQLKAHGYTEKEIEMLDELSESSDEANESLYDMIETMDRPTGRVLFFESLSNLLSPIATLLTAVGTAFRDAFPPMQSDTLYNLIDGFHSFTEALVPTPETVDHLTRTLKGLFAIIDLLTSIVGGGFKLAFQIASSAIEALWEAFGLGSATFLEITAQIGDKLVAFRNAFEALNPVGRIVKTTVTLVVGLGKAIWNLITAIYNISPVKPIVEGIANALGMIGSSAGSGIDWLINQMNNLAGVLDKLESITIDDVFSFLSEHISLDIINGLINGLKSGIGSIVNNVINLGNKIIETIKDVLGIHSPSIVMYEVGGNIVEGLSNGIVGGLKGLVDGVKNVGKNIIDTLFSIDFSVPIESIKQVFSTIWNFLSSIDYSKILTLIPVGVVLYVGKQIGSVVSVLVNGISSLNDVIESFAGIGENFKNTLKSFDKVLKAKAFATKADGLKSLAIAIAILVGSLALLTALDPEKLYSSVAVIAMLAGILGLLALAISKMQGATVSLKDGISINKLMPSLLSIGLALLAMAAVVKIIGVMDTEQAIKGFGGLIGLVVLMGAFVAAYGHFVKGKSAQNIKNAGKMMRSLSITLLLLVGVCKLAGMLDGNDFGNAVKIAGGLIVFVGVLSAIASRSKGIDKATNSLKSISSAILIIAAAGIIFRFVRWEDWFKAVASLGAVTAVAAALMFINNKYPTSQIAKVGGTILAMSGAISLLAVAGMLMRLVRWEDLGKAGAAFIVLGVIMRAMISVLKLDKGQTALKAASTILAMTIGVAAMAAVAVLLGMVDTTALKKGVAAVSILGLVMAAMAAASKGIEKSKGSIIALIAAVAVMAAAVAGLSLIDPTRLIASTVALGAVMLAMSALMLSTKSLGSAKTVLPNILIMTGVVAALAGILALLSMMPIESSIGSATALSILLIAMSVSMTILSRIKSVSANALIGIAVLSGAVGLLAVILGVLSGLNIQISLQSVLALSTMLLAMSAAMGILSLVGGGASLAIAGAAGLIAIIAMLGAFIIGVGALMTYVPAAEQFLNKGIQVLTDLSYGLGNVIGSLVGGLLEGVSSGLPAIGSNLSSFMENLGGFIEGANQITPESMQAIKNLAEAILILTGADILDGLTSWITGGVNFEEFGAQLSAMGKGLMAFAQEVEDIDAEDVSAASGALKTLSETMNSLPKEGGWLDAVFGAINPESFADDLPKLGSGLKAFSESVEGIDSEAVTSAASAAKGLTDVANNMPKEDGWLQKITGETMDMATFGNNLVEFGESLRDFSNAVVDISVEGIDTAVQAGEKLADLAEAMPTEGGFFSWLAGNKTSLGTFGSDLTPFGDGLVNFSNSVVDLKTESMSAAVSITKDLVNILTTIKDAEIKSSDSTNFVSAVNNLSSIGSGVVQKFIDGISAKNVSLSDKFASMIEDGLKAIRAKYTLFKDAGMNAITNIIRGINSQAETIKTTMTTLAEDVADAASTIELYEDFRDAGAYLAKGFSNGISANIWLAEAKARAMAKAAINAAEDELDEHSPSKEGERIGYFFGLPFVNAIASFTDKAYSASADVAKSAKDGLNSSIAKIANVVNSDLDIQPTITPVVDMSNVTASANSINGMFGNRSFGLSAINTADQISRIMNQRDGNNSDVISAIRDLGKSLSNQPSNTYNVNGVTYNDGDIGDAIRTLVRATTMEGRS